MAASLDPAVAPPTYDDAIASSPQRRPQRDQESQHEAQRDTSPPASGPPEATPLRRAQTIDPLADLMRPNPRSQTQSHSLSQTQTQPQPPPRYQRPPGAGPSRRRVSQPEQALPVYTRNRGDDPQYISLLEQWAQTKKYVVPGHEGTFDVGGSSALGWVETAGGRRERVQRQREGGGEEEREGEGQGRRRSRIGSMLRRLSTR